MPTIGSQIQQAYGFNAYVNVFPEPIITTRAPVNGSDQALNGQVWINTSGQDAYIMVDSSTSFWINAGGAAGLFGSLTVNPGPVTIDSTLTTITGTADVPEVIKLVSDTGTAETIVINNVQGTNAEAIEITADAGGVSLTANGAAKDVVLTSATGSIVLDGGFNTNEAIILSTSDAAGGVKIDVGTGGVLVNTTGAFSIDGVTASHVSTTTGDLTVSSSAASVQVVAAESVADAIIIEASGAAGGVQIKAGTGGVLIGDEADTTTIDIGNVAPSAPRNIIVGGGTVVAALADAIVIGNGGVNFAGSSKVVSLAPGDVTLGTQTVNIATGNVAAAQVQDVNISTGTGTKTITLGNSDGLTTTNINYGLRVTASGGASFAQILTGTADPNGAVTGGNGSVYIRTGTSSVDTTIYINTDGAMTWVALTA
jgi:hypothetical protein